MDLPKALEIHLVALLENDTIHSWNIYQEKSGFVCLKVKFNGSHDQGTLNGTQVAYKRKKQFTN